MKNPLQPLQPLLAFILLPLGVAHAHHSGNMFDPTRVVSLTGTVREFQWTNPHCYIQLLVRNERGVEEDWSIEMGAPQHVRGAGFTRTTVKPGDRISVTIHPLRNGDKGGEIMTVTTASGTPLELRR